MAYRTTNITRRNWAGRKGQARFPRLWPDYAWCPGFGQSGSNIRELIRQADGALTTMDPPNDWVTSEGRLCLDLDGSNDHIVTATNGLGENVTFSWWMQYNDSGDGTILSKNANNQYAGYISGPSAGSTIGYCPNTAGNFVLVVHGGFTSGVWYHMAITRAARTVKFWKNGVQIGATKTLTVDTTWDVVYIGRENGGFYFQGLLDDILIYNRTLQESTIPLLYTLGRGGWAERKRRRAKAPAAGTFQSAWARFSNMLLQPGAV